MQTFKQPQSQPNRPFAWFVRRVAAIVFALTSSIAFAQNDLQVANLTDNPDPVAAGGTVTYTLRVANNAGGAVGGAGATVTFTLPANKGLTYQGLGAGSFAGASCLPAPPVAVGAVPLVVSCTGVTFGVPGSATDNRTLVFLVSTSGSSKPSFVVTPNISLLGNVDPDPANNGANDTEETFVLAGADLALTVLPVPTAAAGSSVTYNYTVVNNGPDIATSVRVQIPLDPALDNTGLTVPGGCTRDTAPNPDVLNCAIASLGVGASQAIAVQGIVGAASGSTLTLNANVTVTSGAAPQDPINGNNNANVNTLITPGTTLGINKTRAPGGNPRFVGENITYTITPTYSGDAPSSLQIVDAMPAQTCFNGATPYPGGGWTCSSSSVCPAAGATVTCTRPNPSGGGFNVALGNITIPATLVAVGVPTNTAQMTAAGGLSVSAGNAVTIQNPVSDFRANKSQDWPQNVIPTGQPFNYTLNATNLGPAPFVSLLGGTPTTVLTDVVPAGVTINSITPNGFACTTTPAAVLPLAGPATITCTRTVGTIAVGNNTANVVVNSTITTVGLKTNTVCVSTSGGPPDENPLPVGTPSGNNCASVSLTGQDPVATIADVRTAKRVIGIGDAAGNRQLAGQPITYELEIINIGPGSASNVRVSDTFNTLINGGIGAGQGGESIANTPGAASGIACSLVSTGGTSVALDGACVIGTLPICIAKPAVGANCPVITVVVRPAGDGTAVSNDFTRPNTVTAISINTADPTPSANSSSADAFLTARANITPLKSAVPAASARIGQILTYTVTVRNLGPSRAFNVSATDTLANGLTFISAAASGGGACGTTPIVGTTTVLGNNTVVCTWGSIGGLGGQQTITIVVRPNQALFGGPAVPNGVAVVTATPETTTADNGANITTTLADPSYNLIINKVDSVDPVNIADDTVYTVTGTNTAASVAENVRIIDTLPIGGSGGLTFQAIQNVTPASGVCTTTATVGAQGGTVTCVFPGLRSASTPGSEPTAVSFQVRMRGFAKGSTSNKADIDMSNAAGTVVNAAQMAFEDPANNSTTITTTVRTKADVEVIAKQAVATGTATALSNIGGTQVFDWLVSVRNNGPDQADTVSFTDTLPAGMQLDGAPVFTVTAGTFVPAAPTCTGVAGGAATTCTIISMSNGATASVRIPVRFVPANPAVGTNFNNRASIITTGSGDTNGGIDPNGGNNFKDGAITVSALGNISGRVYHDLNGNGVFDAGEPGIQTLVTLSGTTSASLTSNPDGTYTFGSLPAGTYTVTETQPATFAPGITKPGTLVGAGTVGTVPLAGVGVTSGPNGSNANLVQNITLAAGTNSPGNNFGEIRLGSLAGRVYQDVDTNNAFSPGDLGIGGAVITLSGTDYFGNAVPAGTTATTVVGTGLYQFNNLTPGNYQLDEAQPTGFGDRAETLGTSFATATGISSGVINPAGANDRVGTIQLESGFAGTGYNFGEVTGSIAGQVYVDQSIAGGANNNNGNRDAGEAAIPGVTVRLQGTDVRGNLINVTSTTSGTGAYSFIGLFPANAAGYTITEEGQAAAPLNTFNDGLDRLGNAATAGVLANDTVTAVNISAGQDATGYDFGELPRTTISGLVYIDRNINGSLDGVDIGRIPGVTLTLRTGNDCAAGTVVGVPVTTSPTGTYSFTNVSAGVTYVICETQPVNFANASANPGPSGAAQPSNNSIVITNLPLAGSPNNNFGEQAGSIAGNVYVDRNNSGGAITAGEPGIAGVPITLSGTIAGGGVFPPVTINTTAGGTYAFPDLPAGTFVVTEGVVPAPFTDGQETLGTVTAGSTAGAAGNDVFTGVVLAPGGLGTNYNFGERELANISGVVAVDRNRNNLVNPTPTDGRVPGAGVTITLRTGNDCAAGTVVGATTTNATTGAYLFTGVDVNSAYVICETQPPGYVTGPALPGAGGVAQAGNNSISIAVLPPAGSINNNFLELLGSIAGQVYADFTAAGGANNNNGTRDAGEPAIANVTIRLTGVDTQGSTIDRTVVTNAIGAYLFDDLFPANAAGYTLTQNNTVALSPGLTGFNDGKDRLGNAAVIGALGNDTMTTVNISPAQQATGYDFGELPVSAGITGRVYVDRNRDGAYVPGDDPTGISGIAIRLVRGTCAAGVLIGTTTTAANGTYSFPGGSVTAAQMSAGDDYTVCETQPVPYNEGSTNPGTNATTPLVNEIRITNLPVAGSPNNNFGEQAGSIRGTVYLDINNNGNIDGPTDTGFAGVTVTLQGAPVGGGAAITLTAITNATGGYEFLDLPAASYTIAEQTAQPVAPAGTTLDGRTTAGAAVPGGTAGTAAATTSVPSIISALGLPAGGNSVGNNFGEILPVSINGRVYLDANNNGSYDAEPTFANIPIRITGTDDTGTPVTRTVQTSVDGTFSVSDLRPGVYSVVEELQPPNTTNGITTPGTAGGTATPVATVPSAISGINLSLPGSSSSNNLFGEVPNNSSLSGRVWRDNNNNGLQDGAEIGIAGVTIELTGRDTLGNAVTRTVITDATGSYLVDALPPGTYTVREPSQPTGTLNGITVAGSTGGAATLASVTPSVISAITLGVSQASINNNFGEIPDASIAGQVFSDTNNDGRRDSGEAPFTGETITLTGTDDLGRPVTLTTVTGSNGEYLFANLRPGTYTVNQPNQPPGTVNGITTPGSTGGTASNPTPTSSRITPIVLAAGITSTGNNFGEPPNISSISGRVWRDNNNNGTQEATEPGIAGVTIELTGRDILGNPITRTTVTDSNGAYIFDNLAPGTYIVREPTQPAATFNGQTVVGSTGGTATDVMVTPSVISNIGLGINQASVNNNFGEIVGASIAGQVFNDTNNNGRRDTDEGPFASETITLTGTDDLGQPVTLTTTTGSNGEYLFPNLRPGTYTVNQPNQPPGTVNGITSPGTTGGTATNPTPTSSRITPVTIGPGVASTGNDFGELGDSPDLVVTKSNTPTTFTELNVGTYAITVRNIGSQPTNGVYTVTDRLPVGFTLAEAPVGTGWTCNGAVGALTFTCTSSAVVASGQTNPSTISVKVRVAAGVAARSPVNNAVLVEGGGERAGRGPTDAERAAFNGDVTLLPICTDPASANACRRPTPVQESGGISGRVWLDTDHDRLYTPATDIDKPGFIVEVRRGGNGDCVSGTLVGTTTTNDRGQWELRGLIPTTPADATTTYGVCFKDPVTGAYYGRPVSRDPAGGNDPTATGRPGVVAGGAINQVSVPGGNSVRINQDLPLDPNGVVYDSNTRLPVAGAVVQLIGPNGTLVPANCVIGGVNRMTTAVGQVGAVDGGYSFLLINPPPAGCPGNGTYTLQVTPPPGYLNAGTPSTSGNLQSTSSVIAAQAGGVSVPASCQGFVTGAPCAVQQLPTAPAVGQPTPYFFQFPITLGGVDYVNNHIPVDPQATTGLVISKLVSRPTVEVGDPISYTVQVRNTANGFFPNVRVIDSLPAGFRYIPGTFRVGGVLAIDPAGAPGPQLTFSVGNLAPNATVTITYTLRAGVGSLQGDGINTAQAVSGVGSSIVSRSNVARARVKVTGGVFGNDGCVVGKVYVDCNNNHVQDPEELGIPGVRLYFEDGTALVSDSEGKYSLCGISPRTHVLKVDSLTMPRGSRLTTSSSRNAADAGSLFIDMKNGELQRADFIEGSCSNTVLEQVKARRTQGEVRAPETERKRAPALKFEGKAPNYPQQGTDSANQPAIKPRAPSPGSSPQPQEAEAEVHTPVPTLPAASQNTQRK